MVNLERPHQKVKSHNPNNCGPNPSPGYRKYQLKIIINVLYEKLDFINFKGFCTELQCVAGIFCTKQ